MTAIVAGIGRAGPRAGRDRALGGMAILVAFELLGLMAGVAFATAGNVLRELALGGQVAKGVRATQAAEAGLGWFLARSGWLPSAAEDIPDLPDGQGTPELPEGLGAPKGADAPDVPALLALLASMEGPGLRAPPGLLAEPGDAEPLGFTVQARRLGTLPRAPDRAVAGPASGADRELEAAGARDQAANPAIGAANLAAVAANNASGVADGLADEAAADAAVEAAVEAELWLVIATGVCGSGRAAYHQVRELLVAVTPPDDPELGEGPDAAGARPAPARPVLRVLAWRFGD